MATPDDSAATHLVAFTTAPSTEAGRTIVRALVERRLVACGTVIPGAVSIYRWKGAVEQEDEAVVVLKTTAARWPALAAALPELHPYEVPELVAVPVVGGHPAYLQWVSDETAEPGTRKE
jgi:periplasmic divalent cation tolerance protein